MPLSAPLIDALRATLAAGGQSLVFINRRGYHNFLNCQLCGNVLSCPDCSVSMTFHLRDRSLRCHYCGNYPQRARPLPGLPWIRSARTGISAPNAWRTALAKILPDARIERMDSDTSRRKGARSRILIALAQRRDRYPGRHPDDHQRIRFSAGQAGGSGDGRHEPESARLPLGGTDFPVADPGGGRAGRGDRARPGGDSDLSRRTITASAPPSIRITRASCAASWICAASLDIRHSAAGDGADGGRRCRRGGAVGDRRRVGAGARRPRRVLRVLGPAPAPIERIAQRYRWQLMVKAPSWSQMREPLIALRGELASGARAGGNPANDRRRSGAYAVAPASESSLSPNFS